MVHMCVVDRFKELREEVFTDSFAEWCRLSHEVYKLVHIALLVEALGNVANLFSLGHFKSICIPSNVLNNSVVGNS